MDEELPILLQFSHQDKIISLRIDTFGLLNFGLNKKSISTINLFCDEISQVFFVDLQDSVGQIFEHQIIADNDKPTLEFWADYGRINNKFTFSSNEEIFSDYTTEDLIQKGNIISTLYTETSNRLLKNAAIHSNLIKKLQFEINNDIEKTHRKELFYENANKGKSEAFGSQKKILQRLNNLLNEVQSS